MQELIKDRGFLIYQFCNWLRWALQVRVTRLISKGIINNLIGLKITLQLVIEIVLNTVEYFTSVYG